MGKDIVSLLNKYTEKEIESNEIIPDCDSCCVSNNLDKIFDMASELGDLLTKLPNNETEMTLIKRIKHYSEFY